MTIEEETILAQIDSKAKEVEPKVEEMTKPVESAMEPGIPEPEMLAAVSTPEVEVDEPAIEVEPTKEEEPVVENDPPFVLETVAKAEEPKQTNKAPEQVVEEPMPMIEESKQELAMEMKQVETPMESLSVTPETSTPSELEPTLASSIHSEAEPAPETLAKCENMHAKLTVPKVKEEEPAPPEPVKMPVIDPIPVAEMPVKSSSFEVSRTASTEKPSPKPAPSESKKRRIILPSGASVIPSLDLNNLPPEDDPFA